MELQLHNVCDSLLLQGSVSFTQCTNPHQPTWTTLSRRSVQVCCLRMSRRPAHKTRCGGLIGLDERTLHRDHKLLLFFHGFSVSKKWKLLRARVPCLFKFDNLDHHKQPRCCNQLNFRTPRLRGWKLSVLDPDWPIASRIVTFAARAQFPRGNITRAQLPRVNVARTTRAVRVAGQTAFRDVSGFSDEPLVFDAVLPMVDPVQ